MSDFQVDDERVAEELFRDQSSPGVSAAASSRDDDDDDDRWADIYEDAPARLVEMLAAVTGVTTHHCHVELLLLHPMII